MGDYRTHYVLNPSVPLSDALAASAAVPGLIGPLRIASTEFQWHSLSRIRTETDPVQPLFAAYNLWDGGVYDNLGVEPLYKPAGGFRDGIDFLIVSDASRPPRYASQSWIDLVRPGKRFLRLVEIATDQVRALRSRVIVAHFQRFPDSGVYLRLGNTMASIYEKAKQPQPNLDTLSDSDVFLASRMETTLRHVTKVEFDRLYRHGFEVADSTLTAYHSGKFSAVPFLSTHPDYW
jgi:NTE family protein